METDPFFRLHSPPTQLPYKVRTIGQTHGAPNHISRGTYHDDATLIIILSGKGEFSRAGQTLRLRSGMVGVILPDADTGIMSASPEDPYNFIHCRFAGSLALEVAGRIFASRENRHFFRFAAWTELAEILQRGISLDPGLGNQYPDRPVRVDAILAEALAFIDNPEIARAPGRTPLDGHSLRAYMLRQLSSPIVLGPMADFFAVTKPHLCRVARQDLGVTIQAYWEAMKIAHADLLLAQNNAPINQIARSLGYTDPYYFSRVFRKHRAMSPREFRARSRNTSIG